jgi:hypothetical protein
MELEIVPLIEDNELRDVFDREDTHTDSGRVNYPDPGRVITRFNWQYVLKPPRDGEVGLSATHVVATPGRLKLGVFNSPPSNMGSQHRNE